MSVSKYFLANGHRAIAPSGFQTDIIGMGANHVEVQAGATVTFRGFHAHQGNSITVYGNSDDYVMQRSGSVVTISSTVDSTSFTVSTSTSNTIGVRFQDDLQFRSLVIDSNKVMLGDKEVGIQPTSVNPGDDPQVLSVSLETITTSGLVGSDITVHVTATHNGQAESVTITLEQDGRLLTENVPLRMSPGMETVIHTFANSAIFNPGAVEANVVITEAMQLEQDSKTFGMYTADRPYQFTWADTDIEPFNMIGQVVVKHSGKAGYGLGTGFLISPMHVMTNAHVVSLDEDQEYLDDLAMLEFFLGRNGQSLFQEANNNQYSGSSVFLQKSEWDDMWPDTDMAIITLSNPVQGLEDQQHFDWFWNARGTNSDLTGQTVYASGYPSDGILQGSGTYFQWAVEGVVTGYWQGYDDFGAESGGLKFSDSFNSSGGASGSPIIRIAEDGSYQFVGAYTGSRGNTPVAANLDPAAYDWALTVVQSDGYLMNMAFLDGPWDFNDFPGKTLNATHTAVAYADYDQVVVQPTGVSWEYTDLGLVA